jgi:hypothetical protein
MRRLALLACVLGGCVAYDETVHVRLRDPSAVAISAGQPLLGEHADGSAELPATMPPYLEEAQQGATVTRAEGATWAHCSWCGYDQDRFVVDRAGRIDLVGTPSTITGAGGRVRMRYAYVAPLPCRRSGGLCERPAFELVLDTPRANVLAIDFDRRVETAHGERIGAKIGLVTGILTAALGASLITYYDLAGGTNSHTAKLAVLGVGGGFLAVGGFFTIVSTTMLRAHDSDTPIAVP